MSSGLISCTEIHNDELDLESKSYFSRSIDKATFEFALRIIELTRINLWVDRDRDRILQIHFQTYFLSYL